MQKSLPDSKAARGLTPHDEEDDEAAAGDGEARTSAASAHAGIASRTGETTGGKVSAQQRRLWVGELRSR